ncbi:MAG: hypothetical protein OEZ34_09790 [Spirochaetia bacterium]|nr:hypothetical protein [Spirochaetia bacterium]
MKINMETILEKIIEKPDLHVRWLNTLSFLEHVGSRKILKTQSSDYTDPNTLRHAAEEARHAYFFKKVIDKIQPELPDYSRDNLLCGFSANRYFQSLDAMVHKKMKNQKDAARLCYLYVTTLVEERAGWLYPIYQKALEKMNSPVNISGIIQEEERHLEEMHNGLEDMDKNILDEFLREEERYFQRYYESLSKYLAEREVYA